MDHQPIKSYTKKTALKIVLTLSILGLLGISLHSTFANSSQLSDEWKQFSFMDGRPLGLIYRWMANDRTRPMHESQLFASLNGNEMSFSYAQEIDPFGGYSRCGGFPCWLQEGPKLGSLFFEKIGNEWKIWKATGKISFLNGANCKLFKYNDIGGVQLVCRNAKGPYSQGSNRLIEIDSMYYFIDPGD